MMKIIIVVFLLFINVGCKKESTNINNVVTPISKLHKLASQGNLKAYSDLSLAYMDSPNDINFCKTSKSVAEKYNFDEAYLNLYYCQIDYYHRANYMNLDDLNHETIIKAMNYLAIGNSLGNKECSKLLGKYFIQGKYLNKDIEKGKLLIQQNE